MNNTKEVKVVVGIKDGGSALLGKHFHVLGDRTSLYFQTNNPCAFRKYLETYPLKMLITYDETGMTAAPLEPAYNDGPIAICIMDASPILQIIRMNLKSIPVADFEKFLYTIRKFYDKSGKELYDQVRHLVVKKVTSVERKTDNQGNFLYCVSRVGDKEDFAPTPELLLNVPLFDGLDETIELKFDVHMEYAEVEGGVKISYSLVNPFFEDEIRAEKRTVLERNLLLVCRKDNVLILPGASKINYKTDAWKYKENGLD